MERRPRISHASKAMIATLLAMLAAACGVVWWAWQEMGEVEISIYGYLALAAGATVTFVLGVGLMALVYFSHKHGFDDRAGTDTDH